MRPLFVNVKIKPKDFSLCWGLTARQPLLVIQVVSQRKGEDR